MTAAFVVTALALGASAPVQASQAATAVPASSARPTGVGDTVLDVVMLVDESGSETDANVAAERQTAGTIAQTLLNPRSRVTVVGFGGVNHVAPNQDPVNVVCQPTTASGAIHLSYLASCVNSLHRRTEQEGDDTDYAAALGQAMSYFNPDSTYGRQSPARAIKVILMMTDGGVDVHRDTQQYSTDWRAGQQQAVNQQLASARANHVQIWPLGFGTISTHDQQYLDYLAASGYQAACDNRPVSKPHAIVVQNPANALAALNSLYSAAACLGSNTDKGSVGGNNPTRSLYVSIPAIASDAAISVDRGNTGVQVGFYTPGNVLWSDGSAISGTGTAVEVLHLADPAPGRWRIQLTAPPGMASELVSATVFWQGALDALMTATPSSAQPGQQIDVTLTVLGSNGRPITDPAELSQMQVAVSASGDGLSGPTEIPVSNAGETQSSTTGVGDYRGTFTAPRGLGTLTITGTAAGYGLYATQIPATVQVGGGVPAFQSTVTLPAISTVQAGQSIQGQILFANRTGVGRAVRLSLSVSPAYATISPSGSIEVPSGSPPATPFSIAFAKNSPSGPTFLEVKVVDAANPGTVYSAGTLDVTVTRPPGFVARYLWAIVGVVILLILAALFALWRRRVRRNAADVRGLYAIIRRDGEPAGAELKAPNKQADTFRFVIRDETLPEARLDFPSRSDDEPYMARRGRRGQVDVVTPIREQYEITIGGSGEPLPSGLRLAFRDVRGASRGRPASPNGNRRSARRPVPPSADPAGPADASSTPPPAQPDDPWV